MRALTIDAHGDLDQLRFRTDAPTPEVSAPDEVRVRVCAAALNHLDLWVVKGVPGVRITPGWILGSDCSGVVDAVGAGVTSVRAGDRVIREPGRKRSHVRLLSNGRQSAVSQVRDSGGAPPGHARRVPGGTRGECTAASRERFLRDGCCLSACDAHRVANGRHAREHSRDGPGPDSWHWWRRRAGVTPDIEVLGARVWVTSGSDAKLERARVLGADEVLNHRSQDVAKEIRGRTGKRGVDVVIDCVGEATWASSLGSLAKRGRLVTCGGTSGPMVQTDIRRLFWNQWTIMGSTMGSDSEFAAVVKELAAGRLLPPIDSEFPLERGADAFARLKSGEQFGKVVVTVSDA